MNNVSSRQIKRKWTNYSNYQISVCCAPCMDQRDHLLIPNKRRFGLNQKKVFCFFHIKHLNVNVITAVIMYKQNALMTGKKIKLGTSK